MLGNLVVSHNGINSYLNNSSIISEYKLYLACKLEVAKTYKEKKEGPKLFNPYFKKKMISPIFNNLARTQRGLILRNFIENKNKDRYFVSFINQKNKDQFKIEFKKIGNWNEFKDPVEDLLYMIRNYNKSQEKNENEKRIPLKNPLEKIIQEDDGRIVFNGATFPSKKEARDVGYNFD